MAKKFKLIIGMGIFLILAAGLIFSFQNIDLGKKIEGPSRPGISANKDEGKVLLAINFGEKTERFETEIKNGMTVFDLLKEGTEKLNLSLKKKNYDMGIFIEAIGDKENGKNGKYWLYYVNGELPMVACDKKELKSRDKVEWKFETSTF